MKKATPRPIFGNKNRLLPVLALILAVFSQGVAVSHAAETAHLATAEVSLQSLKREFRLDGVVEAINKATVSAQTSGTIQAILVDIDDYVEKGALIIRLKDTAQKARLKKAEAGLREAESNLARASDDYRRVKDVYAKKAVSKASLDKAKHALDAARARLESARASLDEAREQLSYTRITAPYSGIVTERHVEPGETVQPGKPLMTGVSLDKLRVNVDVPQSLISRIREYGEAYVYVPQPGDELGNEEQAVAVEKITIFPIADHRSSTFKVRLDLPEGIPGLFPGMFVKVSLVTGERQVLTVPEGSVVHRSELTAVYVVGDDGEIRFRHVRTGRVRGGDQVILSGLEVGEQVALDPIAAGIAIMRQRAAQAATAGADR